MKDEGTGRPPSSNNPQDIYIATPSAGRKQYPDILLHIFTSEVWGVETTDSLGAREFSFLLKGLGRGDSDLPSLNQL